MDKKKYDYVIYKLIGGEPRFLKDFMFYDLDEMIKNKTQWIELTAIAPVWSTKYLEQAQAQRALLVCLEGGVYEIMRIEYQYTLDDVAAWFDKIEVEKGDQSK